MEKIILKINGMDCNGCANSITNIIQTMDGVNQIIVELEKSQANISYDPNKINVQKLINTIEDAGFEASIYDA